MISDRACPVYLDCWLLLLACLGCLSVCLSSGCTRCLSVQPETQLIGLVAETPVTITCLRYGDFMCLPVIIDEHPAHLMIDTGSEALVIEEGAISALGLHRAADCSVYATGPFGSQHVSCLERFTVDIPEVAQIDCTYVVIGADHPRSHPHVGLIGIDVLARLGAVMDISAGTITFPRTSRLTIEGQAIRRSAIGGK